MHRNHCNAFVKICCHCAFKSKFLCLTTVYTCFFFIDNVFFFFQVQNAALSVLKEEMMELTNRLTVVMRERDNLEKSLNRVQVITSMHVLIKDNHEIMFVCPFFSWKSYV